MPQPIAGGVNAVLRTGPRTLTTFKVTPAIRTPLAAATMLIMAALAPICQVRADPFAIDEFKAGALDHDTPGLWSGFSREKQGIDANVEVLFQPWAHTFGGDLKGAVGGTINFNGDTSRAYADLRWERQAPSGLFFMMGIGAAIHDGETGFNDGTHKALGGRVLFHPSAELGYRYDGVNSVSLFADHMSDGWITRNNEGMDSVGVRFGHKFGGGTAAQPAPSSAPSGNFAGAYIGGLIGYQGGTQDFTTDALAKKSANGLNGGGMVGYNWQSGAGVFGIEADATVSDATTTAACIGGTASCSSNSPTLLTLRPRFGWVVDNSMLFMTGGLAVAFQDQSITARPSGQLLASSSNMVSYGVAVGGGIETKLFSQFGVRAEVLHYGFPRQDITVPALGAATEELRGTVGRAGFAWYFN